MRNSVDSVFVGRPKSRKRADGDLHYLVGTWLVDLACGFALVSVFVLEFLFKIRAFQFVPHIISVWAGCILANGYSTPDLDLHKSVPKRRWGPISFIWEPYRLIVGKHRGFLSHGMEKNRLVNPISWSVGSIFRVGYLLFIVQIAVTVIMWVIGLENVWFVSIIPVQIWIPAVFGVLISDFTHVVIVDGFLTGK